MNILFDRLFSSIAFGHLVIDTLNGQMGILLAYLSGPLGLTNTIVGLVSTLYMLVQSIIQPVTGYIYDRIGPRWLVAVGVLWIGSFFALAVVFQGPFALILLVIASLGSGIFHPAGSSHATLLGRTHLAGRETTAASYFFVFGQLGFFLGPLIGGPLLDRFGPSGLLLTAFFVLPVSVLSARQLRDVHMEKIVLPATTGHFADMIRILGSQRGNVSILIFIGLVQSWLSQNISIFVPKYLSDLGESPSAYGLVAACFMAGTAVGNILGGNLSDRVGRRRVAFASLGIGSLPVFLIPMVGPSGWLYAIIFLAGMCSGAAYISIFVASQRLVPYGMGLATGVILAFMFSSGSLGSLVSGLIADAYGFPPMFYLTAALNLFGAIAALGLKTAHPVSQPGETYEVE